MLTNRKLDEYCASIAQDIMADVKSNERGMDDAYDMAHEYADGSEYVIYYAKAHELCQNCDTDNGEDFLTGISDQNVPRSYDDMAALIAYGEIHHRIYAALSELEDEGEEQ